MPRHPPRRVIWWNGLAASNPNAPALKWQVAWADQDNDAAHIEARRISVNTARIASEAFPMAAPPEEAERRWPPRRPTMSQACQPTGISGPFSRAG